MFNQGAFGMASEPDTRPVETQERRGVHLSLYWLANETVWDVVGIGLATRPALRTAEAGQSGPWNDSNCWPIPPLRPCLVDLHCTTICTHSSFRPVQETLSKASEPGNMSWLPSRLRPSR